MKITFSDSAISDLESIQAYYTEQQVPEVGTRIIDEIIAHIETLEDHPEIGRVVPEFEMRIIREVIHSPFRIVYFLDSKTIRIIRIWRSERLLRLPQTEINDG